MKQDDTRKYCDDLNFSSNLKDKGDWDGVMRQITDLQGIIRIVSGCDEDVENRRQPELPYLLKEEPFFDQLLRYTPIRFDKVYMLSEEFRKLPDDIDELKEYLKSKPKHNKSYEIEDPLGVYRSRKQISDPPKKEDEPLITIDIEQIKKIYSGSYRYVAAVVLIHELCHALLGPNNYERFVDRENHTLAAPKISYDTMYGCWKEEAVANEMAYKIIEEIGDPVLLSVADDFMSHQSGAYYYGSGKEKNKGYSDLRDEWIMEKMNGADESTQCKWMQDL